MPAGFRGGAEGHLCPHCKSAAVKDGHFGETQRFLCKSCGKQFSERTGTPFWRMKHDVKEAVFSLQLKLDFRLTLRDIARLFKKMRRNVPKSTVSFWLHHFSSAVEEIGRSIAVDFSDVWHIDEMFVKIKGAWHYLWIVEDKKRNMLSVHISEKRTLRDAKHALKQAKLRAGFCPKIVVSDGWNGYPNAVSCVFHNRAKHVVAHFKGVTIVKDKTAVMLSNNLLERLNGTVRSFTKNMRGFKNVESGIKLMKLFSFFYNFIRPHSFYNGLPPSLASAGRKLEWRQLPMLLGA